MLPVNLLNALKEYALAQRTPLPVATVDAVAKTGQQFELGQKLQGSVQAQVAPNVFKVNVSGQLVQMQLPPSIRSGDTVALQVIALQPRLTFSMVNSATPLSTPEQLGAMARMPVATPDAIAKAGQQLELGQKLQGSVQAQVSANVFKVSVSGQLVQMELPPTTRSGDTVAVQVTALQPRLAFSMVNSATPLATPEQLGSTARMLSSMSQQSPEKAYVRAAQSAPLWSTPQPPESKQLAGMLKEALGNSGLFYESHQAQWLGGARSTAQLMHEPQNLTPEQARAVAVPNTVNKGAVPGDTAAKTVAAGDTTDKTVVAGDTASKAVLTGDAASKSVMANDNARPAVITRNAADANASTQPNTPSLSEGKTLGIPDHLQPLVQQQLNALETRQMLWQGNVWPGQDMQWEVHEQVSQTPATEQQRQWVTQIQLDLPNLGAVTATLRFNGAGLSLKLNADTPQTRAVLGNASTRLVSALSDAGIPVLSTQVSNDKQP